MVQFVGGALDKLFCAQHGWMSHAFLHEAAHAVAAIDRAIPFERVVISTPDGWADAHGEASDGFVVGGVHMVPTAASWVLPDPAAALEFVLAGALAERGALGHVLEGSYSGDIRVWRVGAGLTGEPTVEAFEAVSGCTMEVAVRRTEMWLADAYPRIKNVIQALAGVEPGPEGVLVDYADGPWTLSYEEITHVLNL